jgi:hypothetical protein
LHNLAHAFFEITHYWPSFWFHFALLLIVWTIVC